MANYARLAHRFLEFRWGHPVDPLEGAGEIKRIGVQLVRDLPNQATRSLQSLSGPLHFATLKVLKRRLATKPTKQAAEVGPVDMAGGRDVLHGAHLKKTSIHESPDSLVVGA